LLTNDAPNSFARANVALIAATLGRAPHLFGTTIKHEAIGSRR